MRRINVTDLAAGYSGTIVLNDHTDGPSCRRSASRRSGTRSP